MSTLARTRSVALSVAWRSIHNAFTNPAFILPSLLFPLFFFVAFAGGLSGVQNAPNFDFRSGYTSFQFAFVCIQAAGLVSGMQVDGSIGDLLALVLLALAVSATATLWAAGIAMRLRTMQAGPVMQMPVFILLFLAPVYVPLNLVAGWVHDVARYNPFTALLESSRGFVSGEPTKVAITSACLAGLFALTVLWARGGLRSAERAG